MPFGVLISRTGDRVLLALSGEFTLEAGNRFEEAVAEISREPVAELIVDLSGITFMDPSSASLLHELSNRFSGQARVTLEGGSADPSTSPSGGPDHDWTADPTHPHHAVPYIGIPRAGMPPRHRG